MRLVVVVVVLLLLRLLLLRLRRRLPLARMDDGEAVRRSCHLVPVEGYDHAVLARAARDEHHGVRAVAVVAHHALHGAGAVGARGDRGATCEEGVAPPVTGLHQKLARPVGEHRHRRRHQLRSRAAGDAGHDGKAERAAT